MPNEEKYCFPYQVEIHVGMRVNYDGDTLSFEGNAAPVIQKYVDKVGLCVTVTPYEYFYSHGREPGFKVGLMLDPKYIWKDTPEIIEQHAYQLAKLLIVAMQQTRVMIVTPTKTISLFR